ncbi:MAG: hypothetical protein MI685_04580 [Chlorobiales bacterium]|nr:hypothetical protein [Chlorobiales bacterium]
MRDDFLQSVKDVLAKRVSYICSNPACGRVTSGPHNELTKAINIGVAAHITAAAPGGPRYDPEQTQEYRRSTNNGIWLCQWCARLVDADETKYTTRLLTDWKRDAEEKTTNMLTSPSNMRATTIGAFPDSEFKLINSYFVPPQEWQEIVDALSTAHRFLILAGPGGIGKTTTALAALQEARRKHGLPNKPIIMPQATPEELGYLNLYRDEYILFDAPFGLGDYYNFSDQSFSYQFGRLIEVSRTNSVVVTTREEPLRHALHVMANRGVNKYVTMLGVDSYHDEALRRIYLKHIEVAFKLELLEKKVVDYLSNAAKIRWVTGNLRFPHNIYRFVRDEAPYIRDQETIKAAIDRAKDTKEAAKLYVERASGAERIFLFLLTLFPGQFDEESFSELQATYLESDSDPRRFFESVSMLRHQIRYVRRWGRINFEHQDYYDGAVEAIRGGSYNNEVRRLSKFLDDVVRSAGVDKKRALWRPLKELSRVDAKSAWPIVSHMLQSEDTRVTEVAFIPLRALVRDNFNEVRYFLEELVNSDEAQTSDPNYKWILFRKAVRELILYPYVKKQDVSGFMRFAETYNSNLKIYIFMIGRLIDTHKNDTVMALKFFMQWYELDNKQSATALQDAAMYRTSTEPRRAFIADVFDLMPRKDSVSILEKWSESETKYSRASTALKKTLVAIVDRLKESNQDGVNQLLARWKNTGNKMQKEIANEY